MSNQGKKLFNFLCNQCKEEFTIAGERTERRFCHVRGRHMLFLQCPKCGAPMASDPNTMGSFPSEEETMIEKLDNISQSMNLGLEPIKFSLHSIEPKIQFDPPKPVPCRSHAEVEVCCHISPETGRMLLNHLGSDSLEDIVSQQAATIARIRSENESLKVDLERATLGRLGALRKVERMGRYIEHLSGELRRVCGEREALRLSEEECEKLLMGRRDLMDRAMSAESKLLGVQADHSRLASAWRVQEEAYRLSKAENTRLMNLHHQQESLVSNLNEKLEGCRSELASAEEREVDLQSRISSLEVLASDKVLPFDWSMFIINLLRAVEGGDRGMLRYVLSSRDIPHSSPVFVIAMRVLQELSKLPRLEGQIQELETSQHEYLESLRDEIKDLDGELERKSDRIEELLEEVYLQSGELESTKSELVSRATELRHWRNWGMTGSLESLDNIGNKFSNQAYGRLKLG